MVRQPSRNRLLIGDEAFVPHHALLQLEFFPLMLRQIVIHEKMPDDAYNFGMGEGHFDQWKVHVVDGQLVGARLHTRE